MKKLSLDDLRVESFATADDAVPQRGTVRAHAYCSTCGCDPCQCTAAMTVCDWYTCNGWVWTCADTCNDESACVGTCYPEATCYGPRCGGETDPVVCGPDYTV